MNIVIDDDTYLYLRENNEWAYIMQENYHTLNALQKYLWDTADDARYMGKPLKFTIDISINEKGFVTIKRRPMISEEKS